MKIFFRNFSFFLLGISLFSFFQWSDAQALPDAYKIIPNAITSEWIETDKTYNAFSLEFLDGQKNALVYLKETDKPYFVEHDQDDPNGKFSEIIHIPEAKTFFISVPNGNVNLYLYNTKEKKSTLFAGTKYVGDLRIISREEWGADETIRYDLESEVDPNEQVSLSAFSTSCEDKIKANPEEYTYSKVITSENGYKLLWPRQYSKKIQKVVVHHTAEGENSFSIPGGEKIRSIYYYHTVTKGWGDIGYHYLIDQDGNIYEGKAGGDYVVGGHVYCNNVNTIGVSLMGNFMKMQPTKKQVESLTKLLKELGGKYDIDLSSDTKYHGVTKPALVGHRDLGATACPGDNLYSILPTFRKYFGLSETNFSVDSGTKEVEKPTTEYNAQLVGNPTVIDMEAGETKTVTVMYKNTGNTRWDKSTWLFAENNTNRKLWADSIIPSKDYVAANMREDYVNPNDTAHFDLTINSGFTAGTHTLELTPIINGERKMNTASILLAAKVPSVTLSYAFVSATAPENPLYYGQYKTAKVTLKNTGNITWKRSGTFAITLVPPKGTTSTFIPQTNMNTFAWLESEKVAPGQNGVFNFDINGGFEQGAYNMAFLPRIGSETYLDDIGMKFLLQVKRPTYQAQILYSAKDLTLQPGERKTIQLGLRNLSNVDWQENQISLRVMYSGGVSYPESTLYFPQSITKNQSGFIPVTITAPLTAGSFTTKFQILANDKRFEDSRFLELPVTVNEPKMEGQITYISKNTLSLASGSVENIIVRIKNTGNTTWQQSGNNAIQLVPLTSVSKFRAQSWVSQSIVSNMDNAEVPAGKVATFQFQVRINSSSILKEKFQLKAKTLGSIANTQFEIKNTPSSVKTVAPTPVKTSTSSSSKTNTKTTTTNNSAKTSTDTYSISNITSTTSASSTTSTSTTKPTGSVLQGNNNIRVLLSFPHDSANVITETEHQVFVNGKFFQVLNKGDALWARQEGSHLIVSVNGNKKEGEIIRIEAEKEKDFLQLYNWNRGVSWSDTVVDNTFEGALEFRMDDGKMAVINDLDLEAYLRGMAETPETEPNEKRKAMAILARSYASHYMTDTYRKYPGKPYDGDDSPKTFQKYMGYNYSLRSPLWQQALADTKNIVVLYKGEILRTAYFSCSDGKTKTPEQANWGSGGYFEKVKSVYQSVDDSLGKDMERFNKGQCGHGVGLSGLGANRMAQAGKTYKEILQYYYQGITIGKAN